MEAIGLLLKCGITQNDLDRSEKLLNKFVRQFEKLYGPEKMTYNVHLLLRLSKAVKMCGPLWCFSTFGYESHLRVLKNSVHSAKGVCIQIAESIAKHDALPYLSQTIKMSDSAKRVLLKISTRNLFSVGKETCNGAILLGRGNKFISQMISQNIRRALTDTGFDDEQEIYSYKNVICNGIKHSTSTYCSNFKRNNSIVQISHNNEFSRILNSLEINNKCFLIVEILETENVKLGNNIISHIKKVANTDNNCTVIVEPLDILGACVFIKINKVLSYVCTMPNSTEMQ